MPLGVSEHRELRLGPNSQIKLDNDVLIYTEDASKSNQGGFKQKVYAHRNEINPERCIVSIYEKYMSHCPILRPDAFYLKPLTAPACDVWYAKSAIGRNKLACVVSNICTQGNLPGYRTNHSLRASAATRLYDAEVDEQVISEITGHRSKAIRDYKRTSEALKRKANSIINIPVADNVVHTISMDILFMWI